MSWNCLTQQAPVFYLVFPLHQPAVTFCKVSVIKSHNSCFWKKKPTKPYAKRTLQQHTKINPNAVTHWSIYVIWCVPTHQFQIASKFIRLHQQSFIFYLDEVCNHIHIQVSISFSQVRSHFLNLIIRNAIILYFYIIRSSTVCILGLRS